MEKPVCAIQLRWRLTNAHTQVDPIIIIKWSHWAPNCVAESRASLRITMCAVPMPILFAFFPIHRMLDGENIWF